MKFRVTHVFRIFSLSFSALYSPLSGLISPQTDVWVLSPPPLLQSTSSRLSGNKNNAAKQLYLCHKLSTVTNKSSSSVNILVRAQVARCQSGNIFSGLYLLSIVQLSATVRGRAGADLCWVVERPVRQKMCSGFLWGILTPIMAKLIQRQIKIARVLNSLLEPVVQWLSLWAFEVVIEH